MSKGIITGCDSNQEWLLPWWWSHYSKHNSYPVVFFNFGMSQDGIAWCQEKGEIFTLPSVSYPLKPPSTKLKNRLGDRNPSNTVALRSAWFKKTWAFLQSPFLLTCWLDLDCEVRSNLEPMFHFLSDGDEIALVKEPDYVEKKSRTAELLYSDEKSYNTGVVVFRRRAKILTQSVELALNDNDQFLSDQDSLSRAIYVHRPSIVEMPSIYNWNMSQGMNQNAFILHYVSTWKTAILLTLDVRTYREN